LDRGSAEPRREGGNKPGPGCALLRGGAGKVSPRQRPGPKAPAL
jgi:hypothetical protein